MKKITFLLLIAVAMAFSSCMTTQTAVGEYAQQAGHPTKYAKAKQVWVFWGLIPVGRTSTATPQDGNCMVKTKLKFGDFLITGLTGGIVSTETVTVYIKPQN